MPIRDFTDSAGVDWRVWDTVPWPKAVYDERLKGGWLTFQSGVVRKRLAPIPPGWEEATPERLELMCRVAEAVRRSGGTPSRTEDPGAPGTPPPEDRPPDTRKSG
jgi:hypothetical protein